ncbi:MAG: DNA-binding domain-containing protein [Hylemonella sp.]|nr:DNA-binding domain-containing protein [Hylemonella sp.]
MHLNTPSPTPSLEVWQQTLLGALWAPTHEAALRLLSGHADAPGVDASAHLWRGLAAYRSHAAAQATRSLGAAYPVLARLLGDENFDALASKLWSEQPPLRGDLAFWGGGLPRLIEQLPDLVAAEPYLADVARTEWALHEAATAADAEPDPQSYALLASVDPEELSLVFAPGTVCLVSRWPVVTLMDAHAIDPPDLERAAHCLAAGVAETALVWRQAYRPMVRVAQPGEAVFVTALQAGRSLHQALDHATAFDFQTWLAPAVHDGLLLGIVARDGDSD